MGWSAPWSPPLSDGTFWMGIEDLADNMDAFEICDAPLRVGAVTDVRSKLYKPLPARGAGRGVPGTRAREGGTLILDIILIFEIYTRIDGSSLFLQRDLAERPDQDGGNAQRGEDFPAFSA